jgi:sterol desaturase/sphingolipid hydroxylase (fatty acid hydroxylase superfamily)
VWLSAYGYYLVHKKSHLDPEWARKHLPWHYDHHMGPNQDANWCVTLPLFDHLMGTREHYVGTEREARDRQRQTARAAA